MLHHQVMQAVKTALVLPYTEINPNRSSRMIKGTSCFSLQSQTKTKLPKYLGWASNFSFWAWPFHFNQQENVINKAFRHSGTQQPCESPR